MLSFKIGLMFAPYKILVRIPTSLKYSLIKFLEADSIRGNFGLETAFVPLAIPEEIK